MTRKTRRLVYVPSVPGNSHAYWHIENHPRTIPIFAPLEASVFAYGEGRWGLPLPLGTFDTPDEALAALNAHEPTRKRWGTLTFADDAP